MKIQRQDLLNILDMVSPGLSKRDIIEQSASFAFDQGKVLTYNDEIACSYPIDLQFTGAVRSAGLLHILRKLKDDELTLLAEDNNIVVLNKTTKTSIPTEKDILLPISCVDTPTKWKTLPEDFLDAIKMAKHCASNDQSLFVLTCLLFTPTHIDACDSRQVCRYTLELPIKKSFLLRRDSISHITNMSVTKICPTENWVHFQNEMGLVISCRRYFNVEDFFPIDPILKDKGVPLVLPKSLLERVDVGRFFAQTDIEASEAVLNIVLSEGRLLIKAIGAEGSHLSKTRIAYKGPARSFTIEAGLLSEFATSFTQCSINETKLMVKDGAFQYATSLGVSK